MVPKYPESSGAGKRRRQAIKSLYPLYSQWENRKGCVKPNHKQLLIGLDDRDFDLIFRKSGGPIYFDNIVDCFDRGDYLL